MATPPPKPQPKPKPTTTKPNRPPDNRPPNRYWAPVVVMFITGWALVALGLWGAVT